MTVRWRGVAIVGLALLASACRRRDAAPQGGDAAVNATAATGAAASTPPKRDATSIDFVRAVDQCTFGLRGPLLDFGEDGLRVRGSVGEELDLERVEREGASFVKVNEKAISLPFYLGVAEERALSAGPTTIVARLRAGAARNVSVYVNGKPAGGFKVDKKDANEAVVLAARAPAPLLVPGMNEVTLRFQTPARAERDVRALLDWVHVTSSEPEKSFPAPTVRDVLLDRAVGGSLKKTLALRGESYVRCHGFLPPAGVMELELGVEGTGEVEVEARLVRDRLPPVVLGRVTAGAQPSRARFPLRAHVDNGIVGAIEIEVVRAARGVRALVAEPRVTVPAAAEARAATVAAAATTKTDPLTGVVLFVLGTTDPKSLSAWGGSIASPSIGSLVKEGTVFSRHRSSSTLPHAALAAMLAGRGARSVRLEDDLAKLPASVTTVADAARQAGITTALFTGNPMTTPAFGFDRAWATQAAFLGDTDPVGTKTIEEAAAWLKARKEERFLLVVHARGGHPPWFASPDQLKTMPPDAYAGGLDPKHAGELLSRARRTPPQLRFTDADRTRAFALHAAAIVEQDRAFGALLSELRAMGRDDKTLVIVTSDVGVNSAQAVPFGDGEAPTEQLLATPLVIRGKGLFPAGATVSSPTADLDLARTMLRALGLPPPATFEGFDLVEVAVAPELSLGRSLFSTVLGRHSLRWGSLVLEASDKRESLCDVALEPLCTTDVRSTHPLAHLVLARKLAEMRSDARTNVASGAGAGSASAGTQGGSGAATGGASGGRTTNASVRAANAVSREPAVLDAHLQAALRAWGR